MQIVDLISQVGKLLNYVSFGPLRSKNLGELLQILDRSNPNGIDTIVQPLEAHWDQLLGKELLSKLSRQGWVLLHHRELDTPVLVLREVFKSWDNALLKIFKTDHIVELLQSLEKIKSNIRAFISQECQENWEDVLICWPLLDNFADGKKVLSQCLSYIWELISFQFV